MASGASRGTNHDMHFREFLEKTNGRDWVVVRNMVGLDYEQQQNYTLTITAIVSLFILKKKIKIEMINCLIFKKIEILKTIYVEVIEN